MRNWCAAVAMSALLALPLCAQQKNTAAGDETTNAAANSEKSAAPGKASESSKPVAAKSVFALPATPRPTSFPGPAADSKDTRPPGTLVPRYELAGMYDYINFAPGDPFASFNNHGATGSFTYNASRALGLATEVGWYRFKNRNVGGTPVNGTMQSYLFGPRLNWRKFDYFVPFGEFLFGAVHAGAAVIGTGTQNAFALATGGGVDVVLNDNWTWRFAQLDYLMTSLSGPALGASARQNSFRAGTGIVYRWGSSKPLPPPPNHPPVAACSVSPASVYGGSGDSVAVHVNASDPDSDPLTYSYTATGGAVEGTGPEARWNSTGVAAGSYTVSVKVDDGKGGSAACAVDIKVEEKPNHPPTATLSVERSPILPGERTGVTCSGSDPDNDPLTYSYTTTDGQIVGSGSNVQFDATGLKPGSYTVKCTVNDGRGGTADAAGNMEVKQPPEPPQVKQLEAKLALHSIYFPTAQPTVAKPTGGLLPSQEVTLDALASDFKQYLKYRPDAHLILEGHADVRGAKDYNVKLSERRVERTKSYLVEKGVPADHLETRAFGFEKNMTSEEVKKLIEAEPDLSPAEKQKILKNLLTVRLANNRRVDVTLSTTGEQSVRRFPFSAKDALTLLSSGGGVTPKKKTAAPAPAKKAKP